MLQIKTLTALIAIAISSHAYAGPTGGTFRVGTGAISAPTASATEVSINSGAALTYTNGSTRHTAVIDWSSFQVGAGETVKFTNDVGALNLHVLNVDTSGVMSQINGAISSVNGVGTPGGAKTSFKTSKMGPALRTAAGGACRLLTSVMPSYPL